MCLCDPNFDIYMVSWLFWTLPTHGFQHLLCQHLSSFFPQTFWSSYAFMHCLYHHVVPSATSGLHLALFVRTAGMVAHWYFWKLRAAVTGQERMFSWVTGFSLQNLSFYSFSPSHSCRGKIVKAKDTSNQCYLDPYLFHCSRFIYLPVIEHLGCFPTGFEWAYIKVYKHLCMGLTF